MQITKVMTIREISTGILSETLDNSDIERNVDPILIVCSSCDDQSPALFRCTDCVEELCDECYNAHKIVKLTRYHNLIVL